MTPLEPIDPARVPSLDIVEAALAREEESCRFRAGSIDTKAGLLLGAAGVLVALVVETPVLPRVIGQLFAAAAGAAAVMTLWPRVDKSIAPRRLRDRYLTLDPTTTRMVLLNTRLDVHAADEGRLIAKASRLRLAAVLLLAATATVVTGSIVESF